MRRPLFNLTTTVALAAACVAPASAQTVEEFFRGKRMTIYVGTSAGGGTDAYARLIAQHLGRHLPGQPAISVANAPGANGLVAANMLQKTLPRDGTAMATFDRSAALHSIWKNPAAQFVASELSWIGNINVDTSACVTWTASGVDTLEKFMTREVVLGSSAVYHANLLNSLFGSKLKQITGYPGGNDVTMALERGEVQGRCNWSWSSIISTRPQWLRDGKIKILLQFAPEKHPEMPNVPLISELATTERQRQMLDLALTSQLMARPFAAPPGVPADRVAALRGAFMAMTKDPQFLAAADAQQLEISPVDGETIQRNLDRVSKLPPDVINDLRDVVLGPEAAAEMTRK